MWGTKGNSNFGLQVSVPNSLYTVYASTLHVTTVKKEVGTFRIGTATSTNRPDNAIFDNAV